MILSEAVERMTSAAEAVAERMREKGLCAKAECTYMNAVFQTVGEPKKARFVAVSVTICIDEDGDEYCLSVGADIHRGKIEDEQLEKNLSEFDAAADETIARLDSFDTLGEGVAQLAAESRAEYEKLVERLREDHKKQRIVSAIGMVLFIIGIVILFVVAYFVK